MFFFKLENNFFFCSKEQFPNKPLVFSLMTVLLLIRGMLKMVMVRRRIGSGPDPVNPTQAYTN